MSFQTEIEGHFLLFSYLPTLFNIADVCVYIQNRERVHFAYRHLQYKFCNHCIFIYSLNYYLQQEGLKGVNKDKR